MKFMIPFLIAMLPVASIAQSQPAVAPGVPSVLHLKPPKCWSFRLPSRVATSPNATT
jgi:hypothetical protein